MKTKNILDLIGNTPLVRLNKINKNRNVEIWLKLEGFNPSGSIKDRVALNMIRSAEKEGELNKKKIILEATSGNMGISFAFIGAVLGYKVAIVMSEDVSRERKKLISALGANLILTSGGEMQARERAIEIWQNDKDKYWFADQFSNENNEKSHFKETAREIIQDLPDLSHLVVSIGTGGTYKGLKEFLNKLEGSVRIIGVQPDTYIEGLVNFRKEKVPPILKNYNLQSMIVKRKDAIKITRKLVKKEGLFVGISTGAAVWEALDLSRELTSGKIVAVSADRIDRYLSTELFSSK